MENIEEALHALIGLPAWGLTRTHGSAFLLEFGDQIKRSNSSKIHGESHILIQSGSWRISDSSGVVVGCNDDAEFIDKQFAEFNYGTVESVAFNPVTFDLEFVFDNRISVQIFLMSVNLFEDAWILYQGASAAWAVEAGPKLVLSA